MSLYELSILGNATSAERELLVSTLSQAVSDLGLAPSRDLVIHDATTTLGRDPRASFVAAYFGGGEQPDLPIAARLIRASVPIIPTISPTGAFADDIPQILSAANGLRRSADDPKFNELANAMLEAVGLLRRQRRVFISYRRPEARAAANQLHELLDEHGFDAFLDTHDVRPGQPFQEILWRRLVDSDVMLMLDTSTYFESRWTREELGRARAKEVHVLRLVWPNHTPRSVMALGETRYLDPRELVAADGPLDGETATEVVLQIERMRSRALASRYLSLTGRLRAELSRIDAVIDAVGAHRCLGLRLESGRRVWAFPAVGIPTAETLHDIASKALRAGQAETPVLIYDHIGIGPAWAEHLKWLQENIASVRAIRVSEAAWELTALEALI